MKPSHVLALVAAPAPSFGLAHSRIATPSPNDILALISQFFPINQTLVDMGDVIGSADQALANALGWQTCQSDLQKTVCADVVVVFARGTDEPGNVGALAGPPFFDALRRVLGLSGHTLAVQGVDAYGATVTEFLQGGSEEGGLAMASLVTNGLSACPDSTVVMAGYSQGGQVVHKAAARLSLATMAAVSSIVIFGDPDFGQAVAGVDAGRVKVFCHAGDDICYGGDLILYPHLTYAEAAEEAAEFVASWAGL